MSRAQKTRTPILQIFCVACRVGFGVPRLATGFRTFFCRPRVGRRVGLSGHYLMSRVAWAHLGPFPLQARIACRVPNVDLFLFLSATSTPIPQYTAPPIHRSGERMRATTMPPGRDLTTSTGSWMGPAKRATRSRWSRTTRAPSFSTSATLRIERWADVARARARARGSQMDSPMGAPRTD